MDMKSKRDLAKYEYGVNLLKNRNMNRDDFVKLYDIKSSSLLSYILKKYGVTLGTHTVNHNKIYIPKSIEYWKDKYDRYYRGEYTLKDLSRLEFLNPKTVMRIFTHLGLPLKPIDAVRKENYVKARITIENNKKNILSEKDKDGSPILSDDDTQKKLEKERIRKEKCKKTMLERYGVEHNFQKSPMRDKRNQTMLEKYGTIHPMQNTEVKDKNRKTVFEKYGTEYTFQAESVKQKIKTTLRKNYNCETPMHSDIIKEKLNEKKRQKKVKKVLQLLSEYDYELMDTFTTYKNTEYEVGNGKDSLVRYNIKHKRCGTVFKDDVIHVPVCPNCYSDTTFRSVNEMRLKDFIHDLGFETTHGNISGIRSKNNGNYSFDIIIHGSNTIIEYNGLYTHSLNSKVNLGDMNTNIYYHRDKQKAALEKGYKLYWIWEIYHNPTIVKSIIRNILHIQDSKISARKLYFKKVSKKDAISFFNNNHLFGGNYSINESFGLYDKENKLITCLGYRIDGKKCEIVRFCSLLNTVVPGGFTKLIKNSLYLIKSEGCDVIETYADKDLSPDYKDTVYYKNGFRFIHDTGPGLFYTDYKQVFDRHKFQKYKLKNLYPDTYNDELTEQDILRLNKIYPCYTSGNWKFELNI